MAGTARRQAVAHWARNYPLAPHYRRGEAVSLRAADGVRLAAWWLPGPLDGAARVVKGARVTGDAAAGSRAQVQVAEVDAPGWEETGAQAAQLPRAVVVLVHGVMHHARNPRILAFAELLATEVPVLVLDLRGHGASAGRTSLGGDEALDVAAAVEHASARSGLPVVAIGVSLGGASVLLAAGRFGGMSGAVAISAPAFTSYERPGAVRLHRLITSRSGRAVAAVVLRTRIAASLAHVEKAAEDVAAIAPAWIVLVHDPDDLYLGPEHPEAIRSWATGPAEIWWEPGAGHGTDLLQPSFATRVLELIRARAETPGPASVG